jgi:hypothetical protein
MKILSVTLPGPMFKEICTIFYNIKVSQSFISSPYAYTTTCNHPTNMCCTNNTKHDVPHCIPQSLRISWLSWQPVLWSYPMLSYAIWLPVSPQCPCITIDMQSTFSWFYCSTSLPYLSLRALLTTKCFLLVIQPYSFPDSYIMLTDCSLIGRYFISYKQITISWLAI